MSDASPSTEKPKRPRNVVMDRTGCDKETASAALRSLGGDIDAATQAVLAALVIKHDALMHSEEAQMYRDVYAAGGLHGEALEQRVLERLLDK